MDDLRTWVSDKLISLLGYSQPTVVQYVITLSKKASSPSEIVNQLADLGMSSSAEISLFAKDIFTRVEHKTSGPNLYQQREVEAAMLARKQKTYQLLEADDEEDDMVPVASLPKKEDTRSKKFRKRSELHDDMDDEDVRKGSQDRKVQKRTSHDEDDDSESEEQRLRDQREREELEQHIKERDAAGTRKLTDQKLPKKGEEEALRRSQALEDDGIGTLRKVSRQEYLKKREQKKLEELRDDIEDEQYLFEGVKLTEAEKRELRYKKEIYELVKKRTEESDDTNEYRIPEAYDMEGGVNQEKRFAVAMQRYRDPTAEEKMNPFAEQEAWEEHQIGKATLKFGSKNRKEKHDDFDFVFEDQIEFIQAAVMDGVNVDQDSIELVEASASKSAFEKLQVNMESSGSGSFPSTTQPQTISPSKTPIIHEEVVDVGAKRKKVANVWSHAKKIVKKNEKNEIIAIVAVCNYCKTEVPAHSKTHGNNGIDGHVKKCNKNPHNVAKGCSSQPILTQSSMNNALTPHMFSQKNLEDKVVAFVVKDEMPFRVVEGAGFVEMMKEAQPRFKIPNRKKIASRVWDLYAMEVAKIKSVIGDRRVSITTDTWTSIQIINYMVITAHFLDDDWNLHKRIINFTKITSHKGDDIGKVLETCLSDWGIDKVFTITVDNASTNDKAVEYMGKRLKEMGTLLFNGKYLHLRCCCHIINLIVKSGLKFLDESVESIRNCVKYIHSSGARLDQFRECAILLKMDKMSTVPMDVPTRWNSTYTMLFVACKFKKVFGRMIENAQFAEYFEEVEGSEKKKRVGPPKEKDWEKAQIFVNFLKRFHDTTLQLSASKTTTSTLIWEEIVSMGTIIDETILDTIDPSLQEVAKRMESKFKKYWGDLQKVNKLVFLGHVLDPRYKLQLIAIHLGDMKFDATKIQSFVDGLKNCLMELYHAYKVNSPLNTFNGIDDGDVDKELMEIYKNDPVKLNYHLKMAQVRKAQNQAEISNEVDKYLSDPFVKWSSSFDVLEWWKGNTTTFPVFSKIAKDIFAIPSSTVASENAFSLGRRVVDPFRASLHPKMVEALVCTSDWLKGKEINLYKEPTEEEFNFYKDCEEVITSTPCTQQSNASS